MCDKPIRTEAMNIRWFVRSLIWIALIVRSPFYRMCALYAGFIDSAGWFGAYLAHHGDPASRIRNRYETIFGVKRTLTHFQSTTIQQLDGIIESQFDGFANWETRMGTVFVVFDRVFKWSSTALNLLCKWDLSLFFPLSIEWMNSDGTCFSTL